MIRIGIIGVGETVGIAHYHQLGVKLDGRAVISAVYDTNYENAIKWVNEKGLSCIVAKDMEEFWDNIDAVDICTPNFTHYGYTMEAIKRNKHILVEKPTALNAEEASNMVQALGDKKLVNMVGFIYRNINIINKLKEVVEEKFNQIYTYTAYYGGKRLADPNIPLEWRFVKKLSGTGSICDFGSHIVDASMHICGFEFKEISAMKNTFIKERLGRSGSLEPVENDDTCVFNCRTKQGALASFTVSRLGMDEMAITITGDGGMLIASIREPEVIKYWEKDINGAYSGEVIDIPVEKDVYFDDWFSKEMSTFISAMSGEDVAYPDIKHSVEIMRVLDAIEESSTIEKNIVI